MENNQSQSAKEGSISLEKNIRPVRLEVVFKQLT